jgi:hypothetical protein
VVVDASLLTETETEKALNAIGAPVAGTFAAVPRRSAAVDLATDVNIVLCIMCGVVGVCVGIGKQELFRKKKEVPECSVPAKTRQDKTRQDKPPETDKQNKTQTERNSTRKTDVSQKNVAGANSCFSRKGAVSKAERKAERKAYHGEEELKKN